MPDAEWSATTMVNAVLAVAVMETLALWAYHRWTGKGIHPRDFIGNLLSGLMLLAALRTQMAGQPWPFTAAFLAASGVAHALDMWRRWRR